LLRTDESRIPGDFHIEFQCVKLYFREIDVENRLENRRNQAFRAEVLSQALHKKLAGGCERRAPD
jgi:hypothetical protein